MKPKIPTVITVAPRGYSFRGRRLVKDDLVKSTPTDIDTTYEDALSEERYKVVRIGLWWRIKIGDGTAACGKFYSRNAADNIACVIRREFLNGAFAVRSREAQLSLLGRLIADGAKAQAPKGRG